MSVLWSFMPNASKRPLDLMRNITLARIKNDIRKQQIGSAMYQPQYLMKILEIITATEPSASARICKNTPYKFSWPPAGSAWFPWAWCPWSSSAGLA